jgi:hypothetical protein
MLLAPLPLFAFLAWLDASTTIDIVAIEEFPSGYPVPGWGENCAYYYLVYVLPYAVVFPLLWLMVRLFTRGRHWREPSALLTAFVASGTPFLIGWTGARLSPNAICALGMVKILPFWLYKWSFYYIVRDALLPCAMYIAGAALLIAGIRRGLGRTKGRKVSVL